MPGFDEIISSHCIRLYRLCTFMADKERRETILNRRFLGILYMESTWMEETLDSVGARHSDKWFPFREGVSALKLFSSVAYDILHVKKNYFSYNLIEVDDSFNNDLDLVIDDIYKAILKASSFLIKRAKNCGIHKKPIDIDETDFLDLETDYILEKDRKVRKIENPGKTLIYLSTQFLSIKSEMGLFHKLSSLKKADYKHYIPGSVSEEKLRLVLVKFHNLQSLYDTYLSESNMEEVDNRLKILRGHITFIYHLLKSATQFSHYYERHILPREGSTYFKSIIPICVDRFLEITINFFMRYVSKSFHGATELCHNVIDSYAEVSERDIPVPPYRGFHVRPSSLISKIINYYGGRVKMIVKDVEYDPSTPLELFRVNEEINAIKRVKLFELVHKEELGEYNLLSLLEILSNRGDVVVYDDNITNIPPRPEESNQEYLKSAFAYLLAAGKIDIKMEITVKFIGDKRSLDDIELLSKSSYGEDKLGNNIPLPKKLSYLSR